MSWLWDVASNLLEQKVGMGDRHRFFWWIKKKKTHNKKQTGSESCSTASVSNTERKKLVDTWFPY